MEQNKVDVRVICNRWQVRYWDYFKMPLDSDCLYNADHLNEKGAVIVTTDVNRRINALENETEAPTKVR